MVDTNNLELKEPINIVQNANNSLNSQMSDSENFSDVSSNLTELNFQDNIKQYSTDSNTNVNCLALTVKKDYSISVVKHIFVRTWKTTWRVALSIFVLNVLSFFF